MNKFPPLPHSFRLPVEVELTERIVKLIGIWEEEWGYLIAEYQLSGHSGSSARSSSPNSRRAAATQLGSIPSFNSTK